MPLAAGARLGTCEILAPIGAGGMGEVYRARDTALGREVAVKVLPPGFATDPDRVRRFTQEAQAAAALNHPNILAIHHVGQQDGTPYIVSELLEGETLRDRLSAGALPVRKAIEFAMQVASGLASAHDRGIVHRDLKPENLFITIDGRLKILDFGLAKLTRPDEQSAPGEHATVTAGTDAGTVLGTVGYMSPEQVRAQAVDGRTDLFSLGAILYEMLSGVRAFRGQTPADTLSAILREEPAPLTATAASVPPALERIVRHCLEKNPVERFQSARDLAFDLSEISSVSSTSSGVGAVAAAPATARRWPVWTAGLVLLTLASAAAGWWARAPAAPTQPTFHRLTFRRGTVVTARFAPDRKTIVYGASWDGAPPETFLVTADSPESRPLGLPRSDVYAVSPSGEIALSLRTGAPFPPGAGTLARAPLLGGAAPRQVLEKVEYADWGPGESLAVTLDTGVGDRLEYPIGTLLHEAPGPIHQIRVSPDGERVAFLEEKQGHRAIAVVDRARTTRTLSDGWLEINGLAWTPAGDQIWFAAQAAKTGWGIYGVALKGTTRLIVRFPERVHLEDISPDGRVLMARETAQSGIRYLAKGADQERDLSWLDGSSVGDLSHDGQSLLFSELGEAGGPEGAVYLRKTDGSPAVRLGPGIALALSPDGKWALTMSRSRQRLTLLPVGVGEPRTLKGTFDRYWGTDSGWLPDGRLVVTAMEKGHEPRVYIQQVDGDPRPISAEGLVGDVVVSPDGQRLIVTLNGNRVFLRVNGGEPQPAPGLGKGDATLAWSADGNSVFVARRTGDLMTTVFRVDLRSGKRTAWKELAPADRAGMSFLGNIHIGADEQSYAYTYTRQLSELYLVEGLR